jgi:HAD superfamily hydrolase (TIGR01509 family)
MNPELIIFDCDGVLIDSEVISSRVDLEFLSKLGFVFEADHYANLALGKSLSDVMQAIEAHAGKKLPADYAQQSFARKMAAFSQDLKVIPGIRTLLQTLPYPKVVASGSSPERLEHSLKVTKLWSYFEPYIYSATMVKRGKPAPDLFLMVAEKHRAKPVNTIVIEDSTSGIQAAVTAGMMPIGFTGGSHIKPGHAEKLLDLGAHRVFSGMLDLNQWLKNFQPTGE